MGITFKSEQRKQLRSMYNAVVDELYDLKCRGLTMEEREALKEDCEEWKIEFYEGLKIL